MSRNSASCWWHMLALYQMDLVLTTIKDQNSVDLAFALAAEQWPKQEPDADPHAPPTGSAVSAHRASLRPTMTRVSSHPVVSPAIQPGYRDTGGYRQPNLRSFLEELQARRAR